MIGLIAISFLALGSTILFIFWPIWETHREANPASLDEYRRLFDERERLMTNISDLELDHQLHKIETADYEEIKNSLYANLSAVAKKIETVEREDSILRQIISGLKESA